jgi:hypothetical protein
MERHHTNAARYAPDQTTRGETFLLANGSSGGWSVDVDESPDGTAWTLQIESAQAYLVFRLAELGLIHGALDFLKAGLRLDPKGRDLEELGKHGEFAFGWFGSASVALRWDRGEDFRRCFLIIGQTAHSTLHLSLFEDDVRMIVEALQQVVAGLPAAEGT